MEDDVPKTAAKRKAYDPNAPHRQERKFEWVDTEEGSFCIWSMTS